MRNRIERVDAKHGSRRSAHRMYQRSFHRPVIGGIDPRWYRRRHARYSHRQACIRRLRAWYGVVGQEAA